jgi:DNA topoisomerase-3
MTVDENQRAAFELNFEKEAGKYGKSKNKKD